jgi:superfamily II DNA or RNA helicase
MIFDAKPIIIYPNHLSRTIEPLLNLQTNLNWNALIIDLNLKTDYRSDRDDAVEDFYAPCMSQSVRYSRAVGYFRSSIFLITGDSIIDFVKKGGSIRLICSPSLAAEDIRAIERGHESMELDVLKAVSADIDLMLRDAVQNYSVTVLATLIKLRALKIKIAIRLNGSGIYHEKIGIFEDRNKNRVSFIGSSNETLSAWHYAGNFESVEVFCSWKGSRESERVARHERDFESLWAGSASGIKTVDFPEALERNILTVAVDDLDSLDLSKFKNKKKRKIDSPLPHQKNAIEAWKANNFRGVLEHATGSGKTVTALCAIAEHLSTGGSVLVLVPSRLLLEQWEKEVSEEIEDVVCLLAGAGNTNWKKSDRLQAFTSERSDVKRVVIATMKTASSQDFLEKINSGSLLMLVADEVHQIGSPENSKALAIDANKRLGLSATPKRYGDADGTQKIHDYFGPVLPPIISLYDAIQSGRLINYEYFPHPINLTVEESENWKELSKDIRREIAISNNDESPFRLSLKAKMLLIQRSRIAKKSVTKISLAAKIIKEEYSLGDKWLVYCEDQNQLNMVSNALRDLRFNPLEYYSDMPGDHKETLKAFEKLGGILVSIKCLDEGVDIPSISHALILASSQNPRQFIQRRGRVLRYHPSKILAKIHDAIVVPTSLDNEPDQFALLQSELVRAYEFSQHAINKSAGFDLELIARKLGINLNNKVEDGIEEDENE